MRVSRFFLDQPLQAGTEVVLPKTAAHYMLNVLRLKAGQAVTVFNGQGGEFSAHLLAADRKQAILALDNFHAIERESSLALTLVQAISKPDHMDLTIQKAVELGVNRIVPIFTDYSAPLDANRVVKRQQHWYNIMINACEQSGRNRIPTLLTAQTLDDWLSQPHDSWALMLNPKGNCHLRDMLYTQQAITVLVGAEGGLSEREIEVLQTAGYYSVGLGTRVLRTETAAMAILAICQAWWGDL